MRVIFKQGEIELDIWQLNDFSASLHDTVKVNGDEHVISSKKWYIDQVPCSTMKELVCEVEVV